MHRKITIALAAMAAAGFSGLATANAEQQFTGACEEALALSALPARLRDSASVYVLTGDNFTLTREGDGPFTCIVARNHSASVIPQCADAAGADTVIPGVILKTQWALSGVPSKERAQRLAALAKTGEINAPERPGINYMMSAFTRVWNADSQSLMHIPPHVMYYAPYLTDEDVGGSFKEGMQGNRGTPFIVEPGVHGYMTSMVDKASESDDVLSACEGQIETDALRRSGGA